MRARGAHAADLAILVVAADEGMKPQTQESIKILNETKTPFIVAITKVDKPGADVDKVKNALAAAGVLLEGYGGHVSYEPISSKTGQGVNELLDFLILAAEVEQLTYDPLLPAEGIVLETCLSSQRGCETTVLVLNGTLRFGDEIATASARGKVKILENFLGKPEKALEPSAPAIIVGFENLPQVGEAFTVGPRSAVDAAATPREARPQTADAAKDALRLIVKAGDAGSLEAITQILGALSPEKPVNIVSASVGDVVDNDVKLATSTGSSIIAFGNRVGKSAKNLAESQNIRIVASNIIYELVRAVEEFIASDATAAAGTLEVLAVFSQTKSERQIVGGRVAEGAFKNRTPFEIERLSDGAEGGEPRRTIVGRGRVLNLQEQKKDVAQVEAGKEAGVLVSADVAIVVGDKLIIRV
jgi:translation initiation factor IF-2